ncbi:ANTAR domain-containing protein [Rhodococcoides corynebacterioides]|uniref:GAF and ANTAR domain-containing protein n=2 Tax=Rhodococcoides TaxID=3259750 RepID=A0ABS7NYK7_9NOCA|nr:GAF and ANTAR domain-containing protein [Rhodococcus corynebacterioides]MBY6348964.1 GAF and ANTAR domain-containing protein [Rhodococcus corynebacterioides]MBY6365219.1 GAF and ANTAR domain-containing protein [Rhodococcus corynebacterioides]MBY6406631.1 GAF and ANTAR domain-containing protein [Rhodococcus corynebacterioides]
MTAHDELASIDLRIAAVVREVAQLGGEDDHVAELLDRLTHELRSCVDRADYCGIAIAFAGFTFTGASSDPTIAPINEEQFALGDGPCLHAARTGRVVVADCTGTDERWPDFGASAQALGVQSMLCAPIHADGASIGSLTLFSRTRELLEGREGHALELVANAVGDALKRNRHRRSLEETVAGLRDAMNHRAPIEQAKGILMALRNIDADAAFAALSAESQRTNRKLRTVAAEFVDSVSASAPEIDRPDAAPTS